jgi:hypothetical protein
MKSREDAAQCFIEFRSIVENFCQQKITILRVDNAPELTKGRLADFCKTQGITYEKTVPDTPNQNGVAERCNLTLASMARALLIDADLSDWFWPFAIQTAVHIKNRVPHSSLPPNITPFQLWHHYKPNLSYFRPFGAHCTSRIIPTPHPKFAPRGESGRSLGYATDAKGYLIWVPGPGGHGGSVKIRRDVSFHGFPSVHDPDRSPAWDTVEFPDRLGKPDTLYALFNKRSFTNVSLKLNCFSDHTPSVESTHDFTPLQENPHVDLPTNASLPEYAILYPFMAILLLKSSELVVPNGFPVSRQNLTTMLAPILSSNNCWTSMKRSLLFRLTRVHPSFPPYRLFRPQKPLFVLFILMTTLPIHNQSPRHANPIIGLNGFLPFMTNYTP